MTSKYVLRYVSLSSSPLQNLCPSLVILYEDYALPGFTGAEQFSRFSQFAPHPFCERVRAAEHAPCDPFRLLERRHSFAEIVERGVVVREKPSITRCPLSI